MVGKLIKHELFSTVRTAAIPAAVMVLLAVLARIMLETSSVSLALVIFIFYFFSVITTLLIGYFFGVHSFYQSLFTGNGYLTMSLPVTADQLIWAKLISALTVMFASIIVCLLSALIFFIGLPAEALEEIDEGFMYLGDLLSEYAEGEALFIFEVVLLIIIEIPMSFLLFYAIMCVGQLFTGKNRKGIAIALYVGLIFGYSILKQTAFDPIFQQIAWNVSIHLALWIRIIFYAGVAVGCYFLVRHIIKNKVNLLA